MRSLFLADTAIVCTCCGEPPIMILNPPFKDYLCHKTLRPLPIMNLSEPISGDYCTKREWEDKPNGA